jgi:polyphenol oxidase
MQIKETDFGFEIDTPEYLFFFGKKDSGLETLKKTYPDFEFRRVKQVHGNEIYRQLDISDSSIEADGQWTKISKLALAVNTADCVPVLIVHPSKGLVMGLHAGWRGVASRIIPKALLLWQEQQSFWNYS